MSETDTEGEVVVRRKPGRPRNDEKLIFYRGPGGRVKAWNPVIGCGVNTPARMPEAARLYGGLAFDWPTWGKPLTREGDYNAARRTPFRPAPDAVSIEELQALDAAFAEAGEGSELRTFLSTLQSLFDGKTPSRPVILHGAYWMRVLANIFIREAGVDGISRSRFERPEGKVWASVNVLPSGGGYNYTEEAWYGVVNMIRPPVFCVKVEGDKYAGDERLSSKRTPEDLAAAVLASLWRTKGVDSCVADAPPPETAPPAPALEPEAPPPCADTPPGTPPLTEPPVPVSGDADPEAEVSAGDKTEPAAGPPAAPPPDTRTWGEIKAGDVWLKGLTTAKDLQAPMPLSRVLEMAVSHEVTARLTADCRAIGDKKVRNEYKRENLHVWYPAPVYADRFKGSVKENVSGYTGLACLDFDGMESLQAAETARDDIFMEFREVLFAAVSASGLGVYALVALDFDGTEAGYRTALDAAFQVFEGKGYMPDTGCVDPTRARYLSSDPDALSRPDAYVPVRVKAGGEGYFVLPASMLRECWTNSGRKRKGAGKEYLKEALERIARAPEGMRDTAITSVMGTVARLIRNYGLNAEEAYGRVRAVASAYGYDTRKTEDKIRRLGVADEGGQDAR